MFSFTSPDEFANLRATLHNLKMEGIEPEDIDKDSYDSKTKNFVEQFDYLTMEDGPRKDHEREMIAQDL